MVVSEFFTGSLNKAIRVGFFGPYAFVVSNGEDSYAVVHISLESIPASQYPQGYDLPITLPDDVLPHPRDIMRDAS
jgi:hypothetical protein